MIFPFAIAKLNGSNDAGDGLYDAWMPWQSVRSLGSGMVSTRCGRWWWVLAKNKGRDQERKGSHRGLSSMGLRSSVLLLLNVNFMLGLSVSF